jgi:hypothetical protein
VLKDCIDDNNTVETLLLSKDIANFIRTPNKAIRMNLSSLKAGILRKCSLAIGIKDSKPVQMINKSKIRHGPSKNTRRLDAKTKLTHYSTIKRARLPHFKKRSLE